MKQRRYAEGFKEHALRRLGVRGREVGVAWCRHGAWPMARHVVVQQTLKMRVSTVLASAFHGRSRTGREAVLAGLNRRMRKTARTVMWEGLTGANPSARPDPVAPSLSEGERANYP